MQDINKLFSICIPTFERVETLKDILPDLIQKVKKYEIFIYISDNNSQDSTQEYIETLQQEYPQLIYSKIDENRGADRNAKRALELSHTKYRLLFGDHYILYDEFSVEKLIPFLTQDFDAIVIHYKNRKVCRDEDFIYKDKNLFLEELGWYIGMMATVLYRDTFVQKATFEKYYDTDFAQSLTLLEYLAHKETIAVQYVADDIVWNTPHAIKGSQNWYNRGFTIFTKQWYTGVMSLSNSYKQGSKEKCIKNHSKYTVGFFSSKNFLLFKYSNGLSFTEVIKNIKYIYFIAGIKVTIISILLSFVPKSFIKYFFKDEYKYIQRVLGEENV